jgi:ribonuclease HI
VLKKGSYWTVGNGESIDLWEDNWIHQRGNASVWSKKPDSNNNNQKVKEIIEDNGWRWKEQLIHQLFIPQEAKSILQIPLIDNTQEDILTWDGTPDGNYTVKTGYKAIMEWAQNSNSDLPGSSGLSTDIWDKLWQLKVPPKQSHLIWRILNGAIPVKKNLFQKGVRCDPLCPRCNSYVETMKHAFLDCEWAQQIWLGSPLSINQSKNQMETIFDWYNYMFLQTDQNTMEIVTAITYGIWYARNQLVLQGKYLPPMEVCNFALKQLQDYKKLTTGNKAPYRVPVTTGSSNNISWSPPPRGVWKMNVDAHLSSDGRWFSGLLLRRSDASIVGVATRSHQGSRDATYGEAMCLNDALDMVERIKATNVIFEMDSQIVVNAVRKKACIRRDWGFAITRCVKFLLANPTSSINWVKRQGNRVAHELAKWAESSPNSDWTHSVPNSILPYIHIDIRNLYHD